MSVAQASETSQAQVRAYRVRPSVVSGTDGAPCTPTTRARKPCLRRSFSHSSPFGDGGQSGGDFEAEYLRSLAIASVAFSSLQATAHPGVIRAASTFALGWAETSIRSLLPTTIRTAARRYRRALSGTRADIELPTKIPGSDPASSDTSV